MLAPNKAPAIRFTNAIRLYWAQEQRAGTHPYRSVLGFFAVNTEDDKADCFGDSEDVVNQRPSWRFSSGYDRRRENRDHRRFRFGVPKVGA